MCLVKHINCLVTDEAYCAKGNSCYYCCGSIEGLKWKETKTPLYDVNFWRQTEFPERAQSSMSTNGDNQKLDLTFIHQAPNFLEEDDNDHLTSCYDRMNNIFLLVGQCHIPSLLREDKQNHNEKVVVIKEMKSHKLHGSTS